ncbi:hypothetical protein HN958_01120 [Candidatus Falkowbacteria bacterium]|nr:hypothetical protein [Candidatus Falkowbacteria bacterium]
MEEQVPVEQIKEIKANPIWVTVVIAIIVAVVVGSVVCLVQSYKFSNLERDLNTQITVLENQVLDMQKLDVELEQENDSNDDWTIYNNEAMGLSFYVKDDWSFDAPEIDKDSFYRIWVKDANTNSLKFSFGGVPGTDYWPDGHPGEIGSCAYGITSMEQFCENNCEQVNSHLAYKLAPSFHGDFGYSGEIYTDLSETYPSICFEFPINGILKESGIEFGQLKLEDGKIAGYDFDKIIQMIDNREYSDETMEQIDDFYKVLDSIKLVQ